eukprot:6311077-Lingulodinium_polyedra.AAC.1
MFTAPGAAAQRTRLYCVSGAVRARPGRRAGIDRTRAKGLWLARWQKRDMQEVGGQRAHIVVCATSAC